MESLAGGDPTKRPDHRRSAPTKPASPPCPAHTGSHRADRQSPPTTPSATISCLPGSVIVCVARCHQHPHHTVTQRRLNSHLNWQVLCAHVLEPGRSRPCCRRRQTPTAARTPINHSRCSHDEVAGACMWCVQFVVCVAVPREAAACCPAHGADKGPAGSTSMARSIHTGAATWEWCITIGRVIGRGGPEAGNANANQATRPQAYQPRQARAKNMPHGQTGKPTAIQPHHTDEFVEYKEK